MNGPENRLSEISLHLAKLNSKGCPQKGVLSFTSDLEKSLAWLNPVPQQVFPSSECAGRRDCPGTVLVPLLSATYISENMHRFPIPKGISEHYQITFQTKAFT